ncbi:DUF6047 family protein [Bacteroides thetaiotaomicron]|nr:DUF6047 family protein [Bacteroides thetaiotaomicron]
MIPLTSCPCISWKHQGGILVFSDGPAGQKGLEEFYQHLADNYWWIHSEPGPVKQYDMHSVPASLAPLIDASCRKDPDTGRYVYEFTDSPGTSGPAR